MSDVRFARSQSKSTAAAEFSFGPQTDKRKSAAFFPTDPMWRPRPVRMAWAQFGIRSSLSDLPIGTSPDIFLAGEVEAVLARETWLKACGKFPN